MSEELPPAVLIVEDDADIREALAEILDDHGYVSMAVENGQLALDLLKASSRRPALILLDLMMPVMDGRLFREQQLQDPELARIPVVVLSAHRDVASQIDGLAVAAHLRKPMQPSELIAIVARYCK